VTIAVAQGPVGAKSVSIVVPVYNEEAAIRPFVEAVEAALASLPQWVSYKIVFVNDGSTDATEIVIQALAAQNDAVEFINLSRNFGKEAALAAAVGIVPGDAIIPIDVDLQDPPELIPQMIERWIAGAKIVNARRINRREDGWVKRRSASAFYRVFNIIAERPIPENVGDFRLMDRAIVDVVRQLGERARFNKALFNWVGYEADEVTFERPSRETGRSRWSYWKLWNLALDGIFSSTTAPLRIWTYVGLGMAVFSVAYAAFIFFTTLVGGRDTPGYASTVILILTFGGLNMIALGILGEYIGRIYNEVRQRPLYVVRSVSQALEEETDGS